MSPIMLLEFVHAFVAIWFISGLLGRSLVLAAAARSTDITMTRMLLDLAGSFERRMVMPGSLFVLLSGLWLAYVQRQPLFGVFQGSGANWLLVSLVLYLTGIPLVVGVFLPRGRVFARAFDDATSRGTVTSELQAAFADRTIFAAHFIEIIVVLLILLLMVTKFI